MTPDEVVEEFISMRLFAIGDVWRVTPSRLEVLHSAILLIQDYQKLREKIDVDKMMPIIRSSRRETETMIGDYFPDRIAQAIVTYLGRWRMLTSLYHRQAGKYSLMKEQIGQWCSSAKIGNTILVATIYGNYKLKFCGEFKVKPSKMKIGSN